MRELIKIEIVVPWSIGFSCKQFEGERRHSTSKSPWTVLTHWIHWNWKLRGCSHLLLDTLFETSPPLLPATVVGQVFGRNLNTKEHLYWFNQHCKAKHGQLVIIIRIEMRNQTYGTCCSSWDRGESDLSSWQRTPGSSTDHLRHRQIFEKLKEHCHDKNIVIVVFFI